MLVFRQQVVGGPWLFDQELQHPDAASADRFGGALALSGGRLLVGADGRAVDLSPNAGAAYVCRYEFDLPVADFRWKLKQSLIEPRESGGDAAFGSSVALGPRAAAIGAPTSDAAGLVSGAKQRAHGAVGLRREELHETQLKRRVCDHSRIGGGLR